MADTRNGVVVDLVAPIIAIVFFGWILTLFGWTPVQDHDNRITERQIVLACIDKPDPVACASTARTAWGGGDE